MNRRKFIAGSSLSAAVVILTSNLSGCSSGETVGKSSYGIGKVLASDATDSQRQKIFFDNYYNVLRKGGNSVA